MTADQVRIGVRIEPGLWAGPPNARDVAAFCRDTGVDVVDLDVGTIEEILGRPSPIVALEPPPANAVTLGLLELEEEVLADSYNLAKGSFDDQLRRWRSAVSLAPLAAWRLAFADAGVQVRAVHVPLPQTRDPSVVNLADRAAEALGCNVPDAPVTLIVAGAAEGGGDARREALRHAIRASRASLGR